MSAPPAPSFQERFAAIQRDWRVQLPQRLAEARTLLQAVQADPADRERLQALHRLLHTLAGAAGTFGLPDLGTRARSVEHEVGRVMALATPAAGDWDAVAAGLRALEQEAPPP